MIPDAAGGGSDPRFRYSYSLPRTCCPRERLPVRTAFALLLGLGTAAALAARADDPTPAEEAGLTAARLLKGQTAVDTSLHKDARVAVKFDTATDATLTALAKYPAVGAIQVLDGDRSVRRGGSPRSRRCRTSAGSC